MKDRLIFSKENMDAMVKTVRRTNDERINVYDERKKLISIYVSMLDLYQRLYAHSGKKEALDKVKELQELIFELVEK